MTGERVRVLLHSLSEEVHVVNVEDKAAKRKRYYAERNGTKIYLYDQCTRWRTLKEEMTLKTDKELASVLLDFYLSSKDFYLFI